MMEGKLIIFSAPSGSGKTTIVQHLLQHYNNLDFSISATSRTQRGHEKNGSDYYFLSLGDFKKKIANGEFAEWEEVYDGVLYGTLKSEVQRIWRKGKHVLFDVDVKGGLNLKDQYGDKALAIFVKSPSLEVLEKRLRDRKTDSEESIQKRLDKVKYEMTFQDKFDVVLVNNDLEQAFIGARKLVDDFLKS
jgi:guanylate kinase